MKLTIDDDAQEEARQQVAWYAARNPEAASRLEDLIVSTIERIARNPFEFPFMEIPTNAGDTRRARLMGFPLAIIYQVLGEEVLVVAVAHTSRRPGYWHYRLRK
jgi:toxin ParE1/3/4